MLIENRAGENSDIVAPCIICSLDFRTYVYCHSINEDGRTANGVCLKSSHNTDIGMYVPSLRLSNFKPYKKEDDQDIPESWKNLIENFKKTKRV